MGRFARHTLSAALASYACATTGALAATPSFKILYHETIRPQARAVAGHTRTMSFEAYGRRFDLTLQPNTVIARAIPADRSDIEALKGTLEGQPGSWARMTRTRSGWHGIVSDGQELYAIEPAADVAGDVVQPLAGTSGSVMYRLKDALLPASPSLCIVLNPDGSVYEGSTAAAHPQGQTGELSPQGQTGELSPQGQTGLSSATPVPRITAKMLFDSIARDATSAQFAVPYVDLTVGVVADYEFYQAFSSDPEGAIIARMDIVDGIWSSQVGVKISLAPLTVLETASEPFTTTVPTDLLSQLRQYRGSHAAQQATGVTHLMTGRDLDGDTVGIAYMGSVCDSQSADSLSEGTHSTLMSALITAHELGHNFNAPHDGEPGACASTPQTYLMAPKINFSEEFSSCSLEQINAHIPTARCLAPYVAPDVAIELPTATVDAVANSAFTISFVARAMGDDPSNAVSAQATLPATLILQSATAAGGTCTVGTGASSGAGGSGTGSGVGAASGGSGTGTAVTCTLGNLMPQESRQIDLTMVGNATGSTSASVSVTSSNDSGASNNSAQISIQISTTLPSAAPASTNSSKPSGAGAGGGGSLDWLVVALLSGAAVHSSWRRRRRHAGDLRRSCDLLIPRRQ